MIPILGGGGSGRPKILMAQPLYGWAVHPFSAAQFYRGATAGDRFDVVLKTETSSALGKCFNQLYCHALNGRERGQGISHLAMLHGDVIPYPRWLDTHYGELTRLGADAICTVIPLKDRRGVTSTAVGWPDDDWKAARRLTLKQVHRLPETFCIRDLIEAGLAEPGQCLLGNTGCWLLDIRKPWATGTDERGDLRCFFTIRDRIRRGPDGLWAPQMAPEDWNFSRMLAREGAAVWATRKVAAQHAGHQVFSNESPWGEWEEDLAAGQE